VPQATAARPGSQTTPGGTRCWVTVAAAGAGVDSNDVDAGYSELLSPVMDLAHLAAVDVAFDLWYAESVGDDALLVQVSRDGGSSWTTLLSRSTPTVGWQRITLPVPAPLTATMQLRIRAQDHFASTVEALVDGFEVRGAARHGAVTLLASGALGTSLRLGMNGPNGSILVPVGALALLPAPGVVVPGIAGTLLLDPASLVILAPQLPGSAGYAAIDVAVPNQPGLVGAQIAFQCAWLTASAIRLGDNAAIVTLQ
jgi:hypothetical protein